MRRSRDYAVYPEGEVMMALAHATPYLVHDLVVHPAELLGDILLAEFLGGCSKAARSRRSTRTMSSSTLGGRR